MAYTEFYMQTTGSDLNAGSTNADAALVTDVGGTYAQGAGAGGTDRYTASAGTPFSATAVGEYLSCYTAGATSTTSVAQITAVNGGGSSLDISLTVIYGTRPANASTKTAKTGGAWSSLAITGTLLNTGTVPQSTRVNVKNGTYANTSNTRTITVAGATTTPVWWRGYNTTPGDIESNNALTKPQWTWTTGGLSVASAAVYNLFTGLDISGVRTAGALVTSSGGSRWRRCRMANTGANALGNAFSASGLSASLYECYLSANALANVISLGISANVIGGSARGGLNGISATSQLTVQDFTIDSPANHGILHNASNAIVFIDHVNVYNVPATFDAIHLSAAPHILSVIKNINTEMGAGAYDINNAGGTSANVYRAGNRSRSTGITGHENGFGDYPDFDGVTDTVTSWTNAASHDFSVVAGSTALAAGVPKKFENESYTSYVNAGAVQSPAVPTTSGGGCRGVGI